MVKVGIASNRSINISKGIIFTFLLIYFIIFGMMISDFIDTLKENSPQSLPVFLNYIPLVSYIGALFSGIYFIIFIRNATSHRIRESHSRKKKKGASTYKQALLVLVMIFVFIPILSPAIDQGTNTQHFSVYNNGRNGASNLKSIIQSPDDMDFDVKTVQSSLSATERLVDRNILLVLLGPNQFYDPIFEIPYFINFFNGSNSLLLCHDHGSTSTLMWEIFVANMLSSIGQGVSERFPVTLFPDGILHDNESYNPTPQFPIIKDFDSSHPTTSGIDEVILSVSSSAAGGPLVEFFGWDVVGSASSLYSFVDKNNNGKVDPDVDVLDLSFIGDMLADQVLGDTFPSGLLSLPLYSPFTPHVFLAKELGNSRVFVSADASLFSNDLIDRYDNAQFGRNIIQWLTFNDDPDNWYVIFDEAHIRPEDSRDLTSAGIFGFIMQYIVHLSTNPITSWIYPVLAIYSLKKYLPKKDKKKEEEKIAEEEEKKEEIARYRTSSYFAQKIEEYRTKMKYGEALKLLYRRLERKLNSQLGGQKITTENVIDLIIAKDPTTSKLKIKRLSKFIDRMLLIKEGKFKVKTELAFEDLFFEMGWAANNI